MGVSAFGRADPCWWEAGGSRQSTRKTDPHPFTTLSPVFIFQLHFN